MKIQVRDISAQKTKLGIANYSVGVCAIDVNLTTRGMNHVANVSDSFLVNAVR
jgi:hypothetical protein